MSPHKAQTMRNGAADHPGAQRVCVYNGAERRAAPALTILLTPDSERTIPMSATLKHVGSMPSDHFNNGFYAQDILSVSQFDRAKLEYIFGVAHEMRILVERFGSADLLQGKILANLFYEPSTRTSSSFMAAMLRLGGQVIPINNVQYSSVTKGESLPDTIRTLESYSDVIVIRHPEVGSAATAAHYAQKPIINAGDGVGEHPTQALLDLFTIVEDLQNVNGLKVAMVGDLKYGRTVHSLTKLLINYDVEFHFVSPTILQHARRRPRRGPQAGATSSR